MLVDGMWQQKTKHNKSSKDKVVEAHHANKKRPSTNKKLNSKNKEK